MIDTFAAKYLSYHQPARHPARPVNLLEVAPDLTLEQFLTEWLVLKDSNLRPKTSQDYHRVLNKYIYPEFKDLLLTDLTPRQVNLFYRSLIEQGVGFRTIRYLNSILRVALKDAIHQGLIRTNPTEGAILPRWTRKEMRALDQNEVQRFLTCARPSRFYYFYYLAIITGMRLGELMGLKWMDIDFQNMTISVCRQAQDIRGRGIIFSTPKTHSGIRKIRIQQHTLDALLQQKELIQQFKENAKHKWVENDLVFPTIIGTPLVSHHLRTDFKNRLAQAGLPRIRLHDLRHTAATLLINNNVPIIVISKILGHSKPSVTLDFYGHCTTAMQEEASRIMDEVINPGQLGGASENHP